jgi:PEP-CTERM motif
MKSILAQFLSKRPRHSRRRLPHVFAATLCVFFLTAVPALADTVSINQVVQIHKGSAVDLTLNTLVSQDPAGSGTKVSTQQNGPRNESASPQTPKTEALISNVVVTSQGQDIGLDILEEGEVEGTICDCGEILVAGADFPKWPFLFLGAIPFVFISDCDTCDQPPGSNPTPTPPSSTPTPPKPTPEPASLLLFGSGLLAAGAGLRRRHGKAKLAAETKTPEEE